MKNFNKIDHTYTVDMVNRLLGVKGNFKDIDSDGAKIYQWSDPNSDAEVTVVFENGHEYNKIQLGLGNQNLPTGVVGMTQENFASIDSTYTIDRVNKLFGINGTLHNESRSGTGNDLKIYSWTDPSTGVVVAITFENGYELSRYWLGLMQMARERVRGVKIFGSIFTVGIILILGLFVWPTMYHYSQLNGKPVRINRITGSTEILYPSGWESVASANSNQSSTEGQASAQSTQPTQPTTAQQSTSDNSGYNDNTSSAITSAPLTDNGPKFTVSHVTTIYKKGDFGLGAWHTTGVATYHRNMFAMAIVHVTAFSKDGTVLGTGMGSISCSSDGQEVGFDVTIGGVSADQNIDHVEVTIT